MSLSCSADARQLIRNDVHYHLPYGSNRNHSTLSKPKIVNAKLPIQRVTFPNVFLENLMQAFSFPQAQ